jgi:monoamine oxidase
MNNTKIIIIGAGLSGEHLLQKKGIDVLISQYHIGGRIETVTGNNNNGNGATWFSKPHQHLIADELNIEYFKQHTNISF